MKKLSECFEELGFRKEGSLDTKKAFLKNLMREAQRQEFVRKKGTSSLIQTLEKVNQEPEQLSFDFEANVYHKSGKVS